MWQSGGGEGIGILNRRSYHCKWMRGKWMRVMCLAAGSISITKRCEFAGADDLDEEF
jgi:hypothetical protein